MLGNIFLLKRNNKLWNSSYFFVILSYHIDIFETKDNFKLSVSNLLSYLIFALSSCFWGKIILILSSNFAKFSFLTYLSKTVRCKTLQYSTYLMIVYGATMLNEMHNHSPIFSLKKLKWKRSLKKLSLTKQGYPHLLLYYK